MACWPSIADMEHDELVPYVDQAIELLLTHYVPHMRRDQLLSEVETMLGMTYAEATRNKGGKQ